MAKDRVVLIGFMGSGKSTLGELIAARLSYEFVDLDPLTVDLSGHTTVREIFDTGGEPLFREYEHQAVRSLVGNSEVCIAAGGGTPLFYNNAELLKSNFGTLIHLECSFEKLVDRILTGEERPLAGSVDQLKDLFEERSDKYLELADSVVSVADKTPDDIAAEIIEIVS